MCVRLLNRLLMCVCQPNSLLLVEIYSIRGFSKSTRHFVLRLHQHVGRVEGDI